jgi:protein-tyrosine-phosphatase
MGRIDVRSAGSTPGDRINPAAALVLEEWGMDLFDAQQASQSSMFARPEMRLIDVCDS